MRYVTAMIRTVRTVLLAGAAGLALVSGGIALHAQSHAKPTFRFVPAADAIRQYWNDAPNQFKSVRGAAAVRDDRHHLSCEDVAP